MTYRRGRVRISALMPGSSAVSGWMAGVSALAMVAAASLAAGGDAWAQAAPPPALTSTLVVGEDNATVTNNRDITPPSGDTGIRIDAQDATVINNGMVTTTGNAAHGVAAVRTDALDATAIVGGNGEIVTSGIGAYGVVAKVGARGDPGGLGAATARLHDGTVTTAGSFTSGVSAMIFNAESTADATAEMMDGTIITTGLTADGLFARTYGLGAATARLRGGDITTEGIGSRGVVAEIFNEESNPQAMGTATVEMMGGTIVTEEHEAHGLHAFTQSLGAATARLHDGDITTEHDGSSDVVGASGVYAEIENVDSEADATAEMMGGTISTTGDGAYGLRARTNGRGAATARLHDGDITTEGDGSSGVYARVHNTDSDADAPEADATAEMMGGMIGTTGDGAHGLYARNDGLGAATARLHDGIITTTGSGGRGVSADIANAESTADATVEMMGGTIGTTGDGAYGLSAYTAGLGAATARLHDGIITTTGSGARGVYAMIENVDSEADATAEMAGGTIGMTGDGAYGLYARNDGLGAATARLHDGIITTTGSGARGVSADIANAESTADVTVEMTGGMIVTAGDGIYGLSAYTSGLGAATVTVSDGDITTDGSRASGVSAWIDNADSEAQAKVTVRGAQVKAPGENSYGISAMNDGTGGYEVVVSDGSTVIGGGGAAIRAAASGGRGEIVVRDAIVDGSRSGLAIDMTGGGARSDTLTLLGDFAIKGRIAWDGTGDTLNYHARQSAALTFTGTVNDDFRDRPDEFKVDAKGRPVLIAKVDGRSGRDGQTTVVVVDPTAFSLTDDVLVDVSGAVQDIVFSRAVTAHEVLDLDASGNAGAVRQAGTTVTPVAATNGHGMSAWGQTFVRYRKQDGDNKATADASHTFGGAMAGIDVAAGTGKSDRRVGAFVGGSTGKVDVAGGSQETDVDTVFGGTYATVAASANTLFTLSVAGGVMMNESERIIADNTAATGRDTAKAEYDSYFVNPELSMSHMFDIPGFFGTGVRLDARVGYAGLFMDSYREKGAGSNLHVDARQLHMATAHVQVAMPWMRQGEHGILTTQAYAGAKARTVLDGDDVKAAVTISNTDYGLGSFDPGGDDTVVTGFGGAGFAMSFNNGVTMGGSFDAGYGTDESLTVGGRLGAEIAF